MNTLSYKTVSANKQTAQKEWVLVDADGQTLGRLASKVAMLLRGKYKPSYTPHVDCGDNVVIINAEKIVLTGNKWEDKEYIHHTGYPGGQRVRTCQKHDDKTPYSYGGNVCERYVTKKHSGADLFRNLYVYAGTEHKQEAQKPTLLNLNDLR